MIKPWGVVYPNTLYAGKNVNTVTKGSWLKPDKTQIAVERDVASARVLIIITLFALLFSSKTCYSRKALHAIYDPFFLYVLFFTVVIIVVPVVSGRTLSGTRSFASSRFNRLGRLTTVFYNRWSVHRPRSAKRRTAVEVTLSEKRAVASKNRQWSQKVNISDFLFSAAYDFVNNTLMFLRYFIRFAIQLRCRKFPGR